MAERLTETDQKAPKSLPARSFEEVKVERAARVLALQRTVGNRATARILRQPVGQVQRGRGQAVQPARPRRDYVFVMGEDRRGSSNRFYGAALRYYRAHLPDATFVTTERTMHDLLAWIRTNVNDPIGALYIISHANEDGTLSFGLDANDQNTRLDVRELRTALHPTGGQSALPRLGNQVDAQTRIHIKGCDIGRTQAMVELVDEAFGGLGTVTAPTHEQEYGYDSQLAGDAVNRARAEVEARHPVPPPVDRALRGTARRQAERERRQALTERQRAIRAELAVVAERAGTYEAFSGPMFQRPGTELFDADEIRAEVDRLYPHLSERQRAQLVRQLVRRDPRASGRAHAQGTYQQRGQRAYRYTPFSFSFSEPRTVAEVNRLYGRQFRAEHFRATAVRSTREPEQGGFRVRTVVEGTVRERGQDPVETSYTFTSDDSVPDDAAMLREGRAQLPNPERYRCRVEERHAASGQTTRTVVAERVVAYLHHGELDPRPHEHFTRPLTDANFYATSRFAPPRPPRRRQP